MSLEAPRSIFPSVAITEIHGVSNVDNSRRNHATKPVGTTDANRSFMLPPSVPSNPKPTLYVGRDIEFFVVGNETRVDLRQLGAIRRIFGALVDAYVSTPGRHVSIPELYNSAWHGTDAACNSLGGPRGRVYTVISKLRRVGLASLIERTDSGYRITPLCKLILEGAGEESPPLRGPEATEASPS